MASIRWTALTASAGVLLSGCGGEDTISVELSYVRQPRFQVPEKVKRIAEAQFAGKSAEDQRWGGIAADKLVSELDKANVEFKRYELVDRRNLAGILKEHDIQIMSATDAAKVEEALQAKRFAVLATRPAMEL